MGTISLGAMRCFAATPGQRSVRVCLVRRGGRKQADDFRYPSPAHPTHPRHGRQVGHLPAPNQPVDPIRQRQRLCPAGRPVLPLPLQLGPRLRLRCGPPLPGSWTLNSMHCVSSPIRAPSGLRPSRRQASCSPSTGS